MDRYLTTSEAKQKFLSLIDEVEDGDQVIITKRRGTESCHRQL